MEVHVELDPGRLRIDALISSNMRSTPRGAEDLLGLVARKGAGVGLARRRSVGDDAGGDVTDVAAEVAA